MVKISLKNLRQTDRLLAEKVLSLREPPRYFDLIKDYFENQPNLDARHSIERRYRSVLDMVSKLWVNSRKNPSIFKEVKEFEPVLKKIPHYRDHFSHSLNVFLLGYYFINRLNEIHPHIDFKSNDRNLTWMLASTFHDTAYAIQECMHAQECTCMHACMHAGGLDLPWKRAFSDSFGREA